MNKQTENSPGKLSPSVEYIIERHGSVVLVWVLLLFMSWTRAGSKLLRGELSSNDDYMRMVEIRDWLGGQSWFDMHQYRLNPVEPLYSHWSRVSDVLIGGPIKFLTPMLGQAKAELVTVIAYPSLLLLVYLYLATALANRLIKSRATPVLAAFMLALSFGALSQFGMGRIDHHGLQIVVALATCWCIVTSESKSKNLIYVGILCGLALYIGIESAPYVAAACIAVVLIWVFNEPESTRKLRYFGLAMAATTIVSLLVSAPPARWFTPSCDALSIVYTQLTLAIALILWGLSFVGNTFKSPLSRFMTAGVAGLVALSITVLLYPHCLKGPYANLDPRLVEIWLSNVSEAGNFPKFFTGDIVAGIAAVILPVFAIIGYFVAATTEGKSFTLLHRTMAIFVVLTFLAGLVQTRLMFFATSLAIPFATYLLIRALIWAGKFKSRTLVIFIRTGLIIVLAPVTLPLFAGLFMKSEPTSLADTQRQTCTSQPVLNRLNSLPEGTVLTQIDLGAPILKFTHHSVTSAPYHRNTSGILAALDVFIESEETARQAIRNMKADYVIACWNSSETRMMLKYGPDGMLSRLKSGVAPDWLDKLNVDSAENLMVYRVKTGQP